MAYRGKSIKKKKVKKKKSKKKDTRERPLRRKNGEIDKRGRKPGPIPKGKFVEPDKKPAKGKFEPTERQRRDVEMMGAMGAKHENIAKMVINPMTGNAISKATLHVHFKDELELGLTKANLKVAQSLFQKATGNGRQAVPAAKFWLSCRAGWTEKVEHVHDTKSGVMIAPAVMTPQEWVKHQEEENKKRQAEEDDDS